MKSFNVVKWAVDVGYKWNYDTTNVAAANGMLDALKWLRLNECPWSSRTCCFAASGGHLEVLKWLKENRCPWNEDICTSAASGGKLEVLKWLKESECPWNTQNCDPEDYLLGEGEECKGPWNVWVCSKIKRRTFRSVEVGEREWMSME